SSVADVRRFRLMQLSSDIYEIAGPFEVIFRSLQARNEIRATAAVTGPEHVPHIRQAFRTFGLWTYRCSKPASCGGGVALIWTALYKPSPASSQKSRIPLKNSADRVC